MTKAAAEAVRLDPLAATDMCQALLGRARRDHNADWRPLIQTASQFGHECQRGAIAVLRARIQDPRTEGADNQANEILKRLYLIDPAILREEQTIALQKSVGPIEIQATGFGAIETANDSGSRLDVTKRGMKEIGELISAYEAGHGEYPAASIFGAMWSKVYRYGHSSVQTDDCWSRSFVYVSNGKKARLISGGADERIDGVSKDLSIPGAVLVDDATADIIWENGRIVQEPMESALQRFSGPRR